MYEPRTHALLPWPRFALRAAGHIALALAVVATALSIGILGYHYAGHLQWIDSILNASMILGGMGPVDRLETTGGKLFASAYALCSGLAFIAVMGVVLAPWAHRLMHRIHLEDDPPDTKRGG